jgi:hypothetical protein
MRKTIHALGGTLTAAAFCAVLAVPHAAFALEPGVSDITITGVVPSITYLPPPIQDGTSPTASFSGNAVTITELVDASAHVKAASISLKFEDVSTNYPAKISLSSINKGLISGQKIITYQASAESLGISVECTFNGSTSKCISGGDAKIFQSEDITLEISTVVNSSTTAEVLPAGTYSDTLTLKVGTTL